MYKVVVFVIILMQTARVYSQEAHPYEHGHLTEIGVANSAVYFINEEEFAYGLHLHAVRSIAHTNFGMGLGYERIFDAHKHNTIGLVCAYEAIENLHTVISPGITF